MSDARFATETGAPRPGARDEAGPPYPGLRALIQSDLDRWGELFGTARPGQHPRPLQAARLVLTYAGLRAALVCRLAYALHRRRVPLVPLLLTNLNISLHGFDMPPHVPVGPRFYVPHPVGTVITAKRIGRDVTLVSAVTIGMRNGSDFPSLGDGVYVGAGARILGDIRLGDWAQVGANAVVLTDVPADHVAVGVPAVVRARRPA